MAFEFHKDKATYIKYQQENAERYVIPFIEKSLPLKKGMRVMEIGCAEGGVLKAFLNLGCYGVGVELMPSRYKKAQEVLKDEILNNNAALINKNIYDVDIEKEFPEKFDLIVLKDVIEHIHDQNAILKKLREFLKDDGHIFFGFPPWYMPFGGHQQIANSKLLSKLPYYHILPMSTYKWLLKIGGETEQKIADLAEIKETGISIERFHKLIKSNDYSIQNETYFLINPIYIYKFGLKPKVLWSLFRNIYWLRNFYTTCLYALVKKEKSS